LNVAGEPRVRSPNKMPNDDLEKPRAVGGARDPTDVVVSTWGYRRLVELEAAEQFRKLSEGLATAYGKSEISELAAQASRDESNHASYCESILRELGCDVFQQKPPYEIVLGPRELDLRHAVLYAAVALSCVTETLSSALLVQMQRRTKWPVIREVVHTILKDEINHARLGWAQLALSAQKEEVSWLGPYLSGMIRGAVLSDIRPPVELASGVVDLSAYGILSPKETRNIMQETVLKVILPGFRKFGINTVDAESFSKSSLSAAGGDGTRMGSVGKQVFAQVTINDAPVPRTRTAQRLS